LAGNENGFSMNTRAEAMGYSLIVVRGFVRPEVVEHDSESCFFNA
jgi:hypothetical protein